MRKIYELVEAPYKYKLVEKVNAYIAEGWQPQGGMCVIQYLEPGGIRRMWYAQAMIHCEEETDETTG